MCDARHISKIFSSVDYIHECSSVATYGPCSLHTQIYYYLIEYVDQG